MVKRIVNTKHRTPMSNSTSRPKWASTITSFIEASKEGFILFDKKLNLISANHVGRQLLGLPEETTEVGNGNCLIDIIPGIQEAGTYQKYTNVIKIGETFIDKNIVRHTDTRDIHLGIEAFKLGSGLGIIVNEIPKREEVEEALREKAYIIDSASSMIATTDLEGNMTYGNPAFLSEWGFDNAEEFLGRPFWDFWVVEDMKDEIMQALLHSEGTWLREIQARRKDGTLFNVQVSAATVFDKDGNPISLMSTSTDITERKQAEKALSKQTYDLNERIKELTCLYGISEIAGKTDISLDEFMREIIDLIPYGWQYPDITCVRIMLNDMEFKTYNFRASSWRQATNIVLHGNQVGTIEVYYLEEKPILDEGPFLKEERNLINAITELIGSFTERRQAETELLESEERYRTLSDVTVEGIILHKDGIVVDVNKAFAEMFGFDSPSDLIGKNAIELIIPSPEERERMIGKVKAGDLGPYEILTQRVDGETFPVEINAKHIRLKGEDVRVASALNLVERKHAEEVLLQYKHIVSSSTDMLAILDTNYTYLAANDSYVKAFNMTLDHIIGKTVSEVFGEEFFETVIKPNADRCMAGEMINYQEWFDFPAHKPRYMDINYYPYQGEGDVAKGFVVNGRDITERKQAAEALRDSEERFRSLVQNSPDFVYVGDAEGKIQFINRTFPGNMEGDVVGKHIYDFVQPEYHNATREVIESVFQNGCTATAEAQAVAPNNAIGYYETRYVPLKHHDNVVSFVGIATDITERKQAEERLKESEEKYRILFEGATNPITVIDRDGIVLMINGTGAENLGLSPEECIGKSIFDLIPGLDDEYRELSRKVLDTGVEITKEDYTELSSGPRWFWSTYQPISNERGNRYAVQLISYDITERKQAEEALRIERDKLNNIFDAMEDGIYIVNQQYDIQYVNPLLQKDFGIYEGRKCYEYFHNIQEVCSWCKNPEVFAGKTIRWEWYSSKNQRTYDLIDTPLKNSDGSISKLEIFRDITERKRAEEELKQYKHHLEELVQIRTQELEAIQEQLLRQERMAVLGQLSSSIGHELRNPLGVIKNASYFLNMKKEDIKNEAIRENIDIISQEVDTANKIITDLLDFARIKLPIRQEVNLETLMTDTLSKLIIPINITVRTDFSEDIKLILVDPIQISQIFVNLIQNAIQAMPKGGTLTISTSDNDGIPEVAFADEGHGIPKKDLRKIFEPLITTRAKGIGLGLSVCKNLAETNGASILVESRIGKGSKFTLKFSAEE